MNKKIFILLIVVILLGGCRLYEIESPPSQVIPSGTLNKINDINNDTMYLNIESNFQSVVYMNISKVQTENHSLFIRPGRHFVISGDQI